MAAPAVSASGRFSTVRPFAGRAQTAQNGRGARRQHRIPSSGSIVPERRGRSNDFSVDDLRLYVLGVTGTYAVTFCFLEMFSGAWPWQAPVSIFHSPRCGG